MDVKLYTGGILIPTKCGTRFLMDCGLNEEAYFSVMDINRAITIPGVKYIVVRNPMEHFQSALRQDILEMINSKKQDSYDKEINEILKMYSNPYGACHFYNALYEALYWFWRRNRKTGIKIIDITELSNLTDSMGLTHQYKESDYNQEHWENWCEKDVFAYWVKTNYQESYDAVLRGIVKDIPFYESLLKYELIPTKLL